jgi:quercetin dioxygenase-like cupin family protein
VHNHISISILAFLVGGCSAKTATPEVAAPAETAAAVPSSSSTAAADVKWMAIYPDQPDGPQMSLLAGNPKEGAFSAIVKLPAGHASKLHTHPATLHAVVVSGTIKNGRTAEDSPEITAGGMWTQPADEAHFTGCSEDADCIFIGSMEGAMGTTPSDDAAEASTQTVTAAGDLTFSPVNPEKPEGPGMMVLSGDMKTGAFNALVHFPAGATSPKHSHSASYSAAVVSGSVSHGEGADMTTGSYWNQVGGEVHTTGCASEEPCVFFVSMDGAMDMTPAEAPAEAATEAPAEAATEAAAE